MNDPFSKKIRKYLEWSECVGLQSELETNSLIHSASFDDETKRTRLAELTQFEEEYGFVYFGEKQWLLSEEFKGGDDYSTWAWKVLSEIVFPIGFQYHPEEGPLKHGFGSAWEAYTEDLEILVLFPELAESSLEVSSLHLLILGGEQPPSAELVVDAFAILHNLSYFLHLFLEKSTPDVRNFILDNKHGLGEIYVGPEQGSWFMRDVGDYGNDTGGAYFKGLEYIPKQRN